MKYLWSYLCFQVINAAEVLECLFRWMNRAKCQDQLEEDTDTITMIDRGCYCNWGYYWSSSVLLCFPYYSCYLRLKEGLFFGHLISLFIKFIHTIFLFSINPPHWRTNCGIKNVLNTLFNILFPSLYAIFVLHSPWWKTWSQFLFSSVGNGWGSSWGFGSCL